MTKKANDRLEADYRTKVAAVRGDTSLSWEKKELKVRDLGKEEEEEYDRENRRSQQAEEAA